MTNLTVSFELIEGGTISFASQKKLRDWLDGEQSAWSWMSEDAQYGSKVFSRFQQQLRILHTASVQLDDNRENQNVIQQFNDAVRGVQSLITARQFISIANGFRKILTITERGEPRGFNRHISCVASPTKCKLA